MTDTFRSLCAELVSSWDDATGDVDFLDLADIMDRARAALAQPEPVEPTDEDCIDCDITGRDKVLLNQFYAGAQREGGSADEVTLRGIHAVLDLLKSTEPTHVELLEMWLKQYGDGPATMTFAEFKDAARAVLARWGRPAITPIPVSERLPGVASEWFEFSVFDSEYQEQAGGTAPTYSQALSEGLHYLAVYSQDGPHFLELRRVQVLPAHALPLPGQPAQDAPAP